jgi:hypothetical protein
MHGPKDFEHVRRVIVIGDEMHECPVEPVHRTHPAAAQPYGASNNGVEDGLDVGR